MIRSQITTKASNETYSWKFIWSPDGKITQKLKKTNKFYFPTTQTLKTPFNDILNFFSDELFVTFKIILEWISA